MSLGRRAGSVLLSALFGWLGSAVTYLLAGLGGALRSSRVHHFPMRWTYAFNQGVVFWLACSLIVTFAVTVLLVLPFFLAVPWRLLRRFPSLVTVGPLLIVLPVSIGLSAAMRSQVDTLSRVFPLYGGFALLTYALSSTVFLHNMLRKQRTATFTSASAG